MGCDGRANNGETVKCINCFSPVFSSLILTDIQYSAWSFHTMGNIVDSVETQPAEAEEGINDSNSSDSLQSSVDETVIDLDAPEYKEYLKHKRKISRSEGNLHDISYLDWVKTNNVNLISRRLKAR